jgi:CRISPR-associated protein Csh2
MSNQNPPIQQNSDFLFIYEAIQCNPNGDPDQEDKPRMDYDTKTNLVTDTRVKRYIRDFLSYEGHSIFVNMEGDSKVSPKTRLNTIIQSLIKNEEELERVLGDHPDSKDKLQRLIDEKQKNSENVIGELIKKNSDYRPVNLTLLSELVKQDYVDIRMFGSAFAIDGFNKAYTGPIQMNWGYSLHPVELMDSSSIATIMEDASSTFGKDYRVHYSLLGFNGTMNKYAARTTGLTDDDRNTFRSSLWNSIPAMPTRSKQNQYPKLYVEIIYNEGYHNGHFGDLRNHLDVQPAIKDPKEIRSLSDLTIDTKPLQDLIADNKGDGSPIYDVVIRQTSDFPFENPAK